VKILVSGASGHIGSALVPALRAAGHDVVRLVRRQAAGSDEIRWDPSAGALDAGALAGVGAIVNLSGENLGKRWT
jgi:NAD dependent epimerase/dehydratase family enzyme